MKTIKNVMLFMTITVIGCYLAAPQSVLAHCQVPCGIYDDHARVQSMLENAATVRKAVKMMVELAGKSDAQSQNQMVRWVVNKEDHAQKIISTISDYFMTQRIKPDQKDYSARLIKHHSVIVAAMKAKQNADLKYAKILEDSIGALAIYYPEHNH